jgi:ribosome recycling factor
MSYNILPARIILDKLVTKLSTIRTNIINASILDNIKVPVPSWGGDYGVSELATVNIPETGQLMITPFDKGVLNAIEKAIRDSNLNVNPVNNGAGIRLVFPPMTEENRKARVKELGSYSEESKIEVRNNRQNLIKIEKAKKESGEIGEDVLKRFENDIQKEVDKINVEIDNIIQAKTNYLNFGHVRV